MKAKTILSRNRSDSVLGNRMDEHRDFTRMRISEKRWPQLSSLLNSKKNKVVLLEVPKGFDLAKDYEGVLQQIDFSERLRKAGKSSLQRSSTRLSCKDVTCTATFTTKEASAHLS